MAQPAAATGGVANVIIIGTTGSGKSTLGNLLLFGEDAPEHGFAVGDGRNAETSGLKSLTGRPESGACALQVLIDTHDWHVCSQLMNTLSMRRDRPWGDFSRRHIITAQQIDLR